jgi:hypothetical protein
MVVKKHCILIAVALASVLLSCVAHTFKSILTTDSVTPIKIVSVFDCSIESIPYPKKFESNVSKEVINNLKYALKNEIQRKGRVEFTNDIDEIGYGSDAAKGQSVTIENRIRPDTTTSPVNSNDSVQKEINGLVYSICKTAYLCATDSLVTWEMKSAFTHKEIKNKIGLLKAVTNADYCIVNSLNGTIRRERVSTGEKIGVAVATGILSLLSPVGGVMVVPGDETEFKSLSILINLNTGRVEWSKKYKVWQVYAVEHLNGRFWASEVLKKFDIKTDVNKQ